MQQIKTNINYKKRALYLDRKGGDPQFFPQFLVVLGHMKLLARYGQTNVSIFNFIQQKVLFAIETNDKTHMEGPVSLYQR